MMKVNDAEYIALVDQHTDIVWRRYRDELELIKIEEQLSKAVGNNPNWKRNPPTPTTDEDLTNIYNRANKLDPKRHNPITTERIFRAMRVMGQVK